jgi:hypothetical protein
MVLVDVSGEEMDGEEKRFLDSIGTSYEVPKLQF